MEVRKMDDKTERPTKTVYLTPDMMDQWKRSGKSIGEIFRAGLAVSTPVEVPDELRKAMGMLGEVITALANGAVLTWPDGAPGEEGEDEGSQSPVDCDNTQAHEAHDHDGGWCPGVGIPS
jgi:hypothetical protein